MTDLGRCPCAVCTALAGAAPHPLRAEIPPALAGVLLDVEWSQTALWSITAPVRPLAVADLRWHYDLPWWRGDDAWFAVRPADVLAHPAAYPEHARRMTDCDLDLPVHVLHRHDRWQILDGIHRVAQADRSGRTHVDAIVLTATDLPIITGVGGSISGA